MRALDTNLTRREFLCAAAAGVATASGLSAQPRQGPVAPTNGIYDCIVLGGGIAGLTAARDLQRLGRSVLVLEGHNRLGGRIHTTQDRALGPLELGAEYIHRAPGSVALWREIRGSQLPVQEIPKMRDGRIYHPQFPELPQRGRLRHAAVAAMRSGPIQTALMFSSLDGYRGPDMTPRQWIAQHYSRPLLSDFASMILTGHMPGTMDDLSVRGFRSDNLSVQLQEPNEYYLARGYHSLVSQIASSLPVETNRVVERVSVGRDGVEINVGRRAYRARTVLCTFSIGMLKALVRDNPSFFQPGLPALTRAAMSRLESGHHGKVVLVFNERFWPERLSMVHNPSPSRRAGRSYFRPFLSDDSRPVLTALLMSEDAARLDALSQDDAIRAICHDLHEMFRIDPLPRLRYSYRWRWKLDDALAKGGNSYLSVNGDPSMPVQSARATMARASLTAPLFFAGEATAVETQPASVHGAHGSGIRAALQIARYLRDGGFIPLSETTLHVQRLASG